MASTSITKKFDELITSTYETYGHDFVKASVFSGNKVLRWLLANERYKQKAGGSFIVEPVATSGNTTVGSFNDSDPLDITPQDNATVAKYNWGQYAATVSISDREVAINNGDEAIIDLLQWKMQHATDSLRNNLATALYSTNTDADNKSLIGLQAMIAVDPTSTSIGGVLTNDTNWRNQYGTLASVGGNASFSTSTSGLTGLRKQLIACTWGADVPDLIVMDPDTYVFYMGTVTQTNYIPNNKLDVGFAEVAFQQIPVVFDKDIPAATFRGSSGTGIVYFINSNYMRLNYLADRDFALSREVRAPNALKSVWAIHSVLQMTTNARRTLGVLSSIAA